jgi:hypothetical protein
MSNLSGRQWCAYRLDIGVTDAIGSLEIRANPRNFTNRDYCRRHFLRSAKAGRGIINVIGATSKTNPLL